MWGGKKSQEFATNLVGQLRCFVLDLENESESKSLVWETQKFVLATESLILDHGLTSEGTVTVKDCKGSSLGRVENRQKAAKASTSKFARRKGSWRPNERWDSSSF